MCFVFSALQAQVLRFRRGRKHPFGIWVGGRLIGRRTSLSNPGVYLIMDVVKSERTLNELYSSLSARRRYEVWFVRMGLANGAGAWWFRYLLLNPGRRGCPEKQGMPVQVWATWFPRAGEPQRFIQEFPLDALELSANRREPFRFKIGDSAIEANCCRGVLQVDTHTVTWNLDYQSSFRTRLSHKGWIGFSQTPHSDAFFSGRITLDGARFEGNPLGFGLQGHNCGYRHRGFWTWMHAYFHRGKLPPSTLEALVYDMPFGLIFRKAVLWHDGEPHEFRQLHESSDNSNGFRWGFRAIEKGGLQLEAEIDGYGLSIHRVPYLKTDCSGSLEVVNNSLASATLRLKQRDGRVEELRTNNGAVLEMGGNRPGVGREFSSQ
jgi:hypothetical protein